MLENFDVIDFLPKNEFLETQVECDHLVLGSGTEISVAFPESVHGLGLVLHPDIIGLSPFKSQQGVYQLLQLNHLQSYKIL